MLNKLFQMDWLKHLLLAKNLRLPAALDTAEIVVVSRNIGEVDKEIEALAAAFAMVMAVESELVAA